MKTTRTLRVLLLLLSLAMILPVMAACKKDPDTDPEGTGAETVATTKNDFASLFKPPVITVDPNASVYSGTPDTSWYEAGKTEFTLTSADQFAGFLELRSETVNFEGVTVKLGCDMIINQGSSEEIKARGADNHQLRKIPSTMPFKGTFDGQNHTISGVYMQLTDSAVSGLFGSIGGNATFGNFNLINSYFGGPTTGEGKDTMGGLVSVIEKDAKVLFEYIHVQAIMEECGQKLTKVGAYIGGIYENCELAMSNCTFDGSVSITGEYAGGFIGRIEATQSKIRIGSCTNFGNVTAVSYCGGMIGQMKSQNATVSDCINRGKLTCDGYKGSLIGEKVVLNEPFEGARPETPDGKTAVRVMSFNVQANLKAVNGVIGTPGYNRIEAVRQEILYHMPDFLGLQEDSGYWLTNLKLDDYNLLQFSQGLSMSSERCAIYYRKGIPLLESGMNWLTSSGTGSGCALTMTDLTTPTSRYYMTNEELAKIFIDPAKGDADIYAKKYKYTDAKTGEVVNYSSGYSMMSTRKMTWGVFDINGQTVIYINTHLNHRSQNAEYSNETYLKIRSFERVKEFSYMQEVIAKLQAKYPNSPVFMTGDWNDNPFSEIYNVVTEEAGFKSAHLSTTEVYGVTGSWNNAFNVDKQGDTYPSSKEGTDANYLDYCFVSSNVDVLRFVNGEGKAKITTKDGKEKYIYTSDHRPVISDICFTTPKSGPLYSDGTNTPTEDLSKPSYYTGIPDTTWYTGDKTEYTLTTANQFMGLQLLRQDGGGAVTFKGITFKLARDLIFNDGTVEEYLKQDHLLSAQALNSGYLFEGTFDGQNHTISGIYMKCSGSAVKGLFGGIGEGAVIKNLTLKNCYMGSADVSNKNTLGILAARITGTNVLISNVKVVDSTLAEDNNNFDYVGGLIGRVDGTGSVTLENCEIGGKMEFGTYGSYCGSLVGTVYTGGKVTVTNCKSTMDITCKDYAGGLIGSASNVNDVTIDAQSSYTGTITCPGEHKDTLIGNK